MPHFLIESACEGTSNTLLKNKNKINKPENFIPLKFDSIRFNIHLIEFQYQIPIWNASLQINMKGSFKMMNDMALESKLAMEKHLKSFTKKGKSLKKSHYDPMYFIILSSYLHLITIIQSMEKNQKSYKNFLQKMSEKETSHGKIIKISGSMIIAELPGIQINQIVKIGCQKILGEVTKVENNLAYVQCFENIFNLSAGDVIQRTYRPLSVDLGPGIFHKIFDGIQRPLKEITNQLSQTYIPSGINIAALDRNKLWEFNSKKRSNGHLIELKVGDILSEGDIFGSVFENNLFPYHHLLVPPQCKGRITYIAPLGQYTIDQKILELELNGIKKEYSMHHQWPVRKPRPINQRFQGEIPLVTGIRVLDAIFPCTLGGTIIFPRAPNCGNSLISSLITKSNIDAMISVNCGERAFETTKNLQHSIHTMMIKEDHYEYTMNKSVLIVNSANMSASIRQASLYTGITIAEYLRDMGKNLAFQADSLSVWAQAIRQNSTQMPSLNHFNYELEIKNKLTQLYERAGEVSCLGSPQRLGSITMINSVDMSNKQTNLVESTALDLSKVFWALDPELSLRRHYPQVNWLRSTSKYDRVVDKFYNNNYDKDFEFLKRTIKQILSQQQKLYEKIQQQKLYVEMLISNQQKLTLDTAMLIRRQFLQQNLFSNHDLKSLPEKTIGMMKCIVSYYQEGKILFQSKSIQNSNFNFEEFRIETSELMKKLKYMKFEGSDTNKEKLMAFYEGLNKEIKKFFINLADKIEEHHGKK